MIASLGTRMAPVWALRQPAGSLLFVASLSSSLSIGLLERPKLAGAFNQRSTFKFQLANMQPVWQVIT